MPTYRAVVTIDHPVLGGRGTNTWHGRTEAGGPTEATEWDGLITLIKQFYLDVAPGIALGATFTCDGVGSGVGDDEGNFQSGTSFTVNSTYGGEPLPPANCAVVGWRGSSGDRSRRGRTFLGPIPVGAATSSGHIAAAQVTTYRTAAENLIADSMGEGNGALGVWSRQEGVFRDFVGASVRNQFAVLRSRRD